MHLRILINMAKRRKIKRRKVHKRRSSSTPFTQSTKFTKGRRKIIYEGLKAGIPIHRVCGLAGIDVRTYHKWMNKGKKNKNKPSYRAFRKRIKRIEVALEKESIDIIRKAARGGNDIVETKITLLDNRPKEITRVKKKANPQWQAAAWWLERRHREDYGRTIDATMQDRTVEDMALEVRDAVSTLLNSVPSQPDN